MINKSKKGVTLVELVICCVIMVLLGGACTAVIVSGQKLFLTGSQTANKQLEANVLQTTMVNSLPKMVDVEQDSVINVKTAIATNGGVGIYFDDSTSVFTISCDGSDITVNGVKEFTYEFKQVGTNTDTARTQVVYTAKMSSDSTDSPISGGVVLTNTKHSAVASFCSSTALGANTALYFSVPAEDVGDT